MGVMRIVWGIWKSWVPLSMEVVVRQWPYGEEWNVRLLGIIASLERAHERSLSYLCDMEQECENKNKIKLQHAGVPTLSPTNHIVCMTTKDPKTTRSRNQWSILNIWRDRNELKSCSPDQRQRTLESWRFSTKPTQKWNWRESFRSESEHSVNEIFGP